MFKLKFNEKIDLILAIAGLILGLVIMSLYRISPTIYLFSIGLFLILACLLYLFIRRDIIYSFDYIQIPKKEKLILEISFFLLFSTSILVLHTSLMRPLLYFILISACVGLLAASIFFIDSNTEKGVQIIKIFLVSFNLKYSIYNLTSAIPGTDSFIHAKMNEMLTEVGNISALFGKETYFPIMHIQTSITQILTETPIRDATNIAIIIPFVFMSIFVYLAFRELFDDKIGLLAMLLLNVTDFHIYWGSAPQTTTYGIMLFYLSLFLLIKNNVQINVKLVVLTLILIFTLIGTHAVSSFVFLITIIGLVVGGTLYKLLIFKKEKIYSTSLALITSIVLLQHWFNVGAKSGNSFFSGTVIMLDYYLTKHAALLNRPEAIGVVSGTIKIAPFTERFANVFGFSILIFFAVIGCLIWLSPKHIDKLKFSVIICITILLGITFVFPLFGIKNILPYRWFAFEYFLLSPMAAFSIVYISSLINIKAAKKIFLIAIFFIFAFFMSANTISNVDSPLWSEQITISTTYTAAEIRGAETLLQYSDNVFSDRMYGSLVISNYLGANTSYLYNKEQILEINNGIFLWRNYMLGRPIRTYIQLEGYNRSILHPQILESDTLNELNQMNRVYDNSEIIGFYISNNKH